ncbi:hypothetical protein ACQ4PT_051778 [Festuca glaucescens]
MVGTVAKDVATEPELLLERSRAINRAGRRQAGPRRRPDRRQVLPRARAGRAGGGGAEGAPAEPDLPGGRGAGVRRRVSALSRRPRRQLPRLGAVRAAYESLLAVARERLRAVYFVHPGLQARLFFATVGRFLFSSGYGAPDLLITRLSTRRPSPVLFCCNQIGSCRLYEKLRYMSRLEYLWAHVDKTELEVPGCARRHDDELERRPLMDYGIEAADRRCMFDAASMDTSASLHSLRCIS